VSLLDNCKIILVDDEPDSLKLAHDILALNGAEVYSASDGQQFLELLESIRANLVIVDLAMPTPNGWELLAEIHARPALADIPVVALTAYYSDKVIQEALKAGFVMLVPKPIRATSFVNEVQKILMG
jgi:two-component system cell cycle response regulator DivK